MRTLFLDVASHSGLLACIDDAHIVVERSVDHRIADHELLPILRELMEKAGWSYADLQHIACVVGPGGFTSLRVGVTFANTLAWAQKIPAAGIHLSDLYAARAAAAQSTADTPSFLWLHSTKKHELFVRGFGDLAEWWPTPTHTTTENFCSAHPQAFSWVGELIPEHQTMVAEMGGTTAPTKSLSDILPAFLNTLDYESTLLSPWYGREG
jgi:tRNA threonylcarbamoyladenosine biosynthesis protein TsaB